MSVVNARKASMYRPSSHAMDASRNLVSTDAGRVAGALCADKLAGIDTVHASTAREYHCVQRELLARGVSSVTVKWEESSQ
jgi:hypothetical protein